MLNLPESLVSCIIYPLQSHIMMKVISFGWGGNKLLDYLRLQVAEITLLQLMPGFYLTIIFLFSVLLIISSFYLIKFIRESDEKKKVGTKTFLRLFLKRDRRLTTFFLGIIACFFFTEIIPLSFESFTIMSTGTLANIWSINEFIQVEASLAFLLFGISQLPVLVTGPDYTISDWKIAPIYLKDYLFIVTILAGICTPTVDIATQLNFVTVGISFYVLMIILIQKSGERICPD